MLFISYSRKNLPEVKAIVDQIERLTGQKCWIDLRGIESGNPEFESSIIEAINQSETMLFFLSKESLASPNTHDELRFALAKKKHVVIVRIDNTPPDDWIRFKFGGSDQIDWYKPEQREKLLVQLGKEPEDTTPDRLYKYALRFASVCVFYGILFYISFFISNILGLNRWYELGLNYMSISVWLKEGVRLVGMIVACTVLWLYRSRLPKLTDRQWKMTSGLAVCAFVFALMAVFSVNFVLTDGPGAERIHSGVPAPVLFRDMGMLLTVRYYMLHLLEFYYAAWLWMMSCRGGSERLTPVFSQSLLFTAVVGVILLIMMAVASVTLVCTGHVPGWSVSGLLLGFEITLPAILIVFFACRYGNTRDALIRTLVYCAMVAYIVVSVYYVVKKRKDAREWNEYCLERRRERMEEKKASEGEAYSLTPEDMENQK